MCRTESYNDPLTGAVPKSIQALYLQKEYDINNSGLPSNSIVQLCLDKDENLWIGTYGGVAKFDGVDQWTIYNKLNSGLLWDEINIIAIDKMDNKWFGVHFSGLTVFREGGVILSAQEDNPNQVVNSFSLSQNYPNPFNPTTHIKYSVPENGYISLKVYNILGEEVATLFDGVRQAGNYLATFDGRGLAVGVYLYQLKATNFLETKKLILLK